MSPVAALPQGIGREPIVIITIKDEGGLRRDARVAHQLLELLLGQDIAPHLVAELGLPVPADGAANMPLLIRRGVHIDLDDADAGVIEVLG
jgi:hypothetical protein